MFKDDSDDGKPGKVEVGGKGAKETILVTIRAKATKAYSHGNVCGSEVA